MHIFVTLVKRELVGNLTNSRYVLTSVLCIVLCLTSVILMSNDYPKRLKRFDLRHYTYGHRAIAKSPAPLSLIAKGLDEVTGRPALPEGPQAYPIAFPYTAYGEEQHLFDMVTTPDFVYVVSIILSGLAIFLSFNAICGEKETRTLSLVMSHPVPRSTLLLAKWIGGYSSFLISLIPSLLLMFVYLILFSGVQFGTDHWIRLFVIVILSFAYLAVFFTFGLLVSTLTHRGSTALALVLCIWAIWALGVPRIAIIASRVTKPVQAQWKLRQQKRPFTEDKDGITEQDRQTLWRMNDDFISSIHGQISMGQHLSRISPLASYVYAATTLAQTGLPDIEDYWQDAQRWNRGRIRSEDSSEFVYQPLRLRQSLPKTVVDVSLLMIWNIMLFLGANMAFLRYDVR
jgi:ABC-type transport system involved in multi-copper enzyme maturation permease subunit